MSNLPEQARTYASYLPIPVLMAIREGREMSDEQKMTHEEWARMHSRQASNEHVEREAELVKLREDKAALLAACKELLKHPDGDDALGGDLSHLDKAIELAEIAVTQAETP